MQSIKIGKMQFECYYDIPADWFENWSIEISNNMTAYEIADSLQTFIENNDIAYNLVKVNRTEKADTKVIIKRYNRRWHFTYFIRDASAGFYLNKKSYNLNDYVE